MTTAARVPHLSDSLILDIEPKPAPRPRLGKFSAYNCPKYTAWKTLAALVIKHRCRARFTGPVSLALEFVCTRPKKPSNPFPAPDLDNYSKSTLDAMTQAGVWADDKQAVRLSVSKRWTASGEEAHTRIDIKECEPVRAAGGGALTIGEAVARLLALQEEHGAEAALSWQDLA